MSSLIQSSHSKSVLFCALKTLWRDREYSNLLTLLPLYCHKAGKEISIAPKRLKQIKAICHDRLSVAAHVPHVKHGRHTEAIIWENIYLWLENKRGRPQAPLADSEGSGNHRKASTARDLQMDSQAAPPQHANTPKPLNQQPSPEISHESK